MLYVLPKSGRLDLIVMFAKTRIAGQSIQQVQDCPERSEGVE